eukprot:1140115-Pelagomonas_calceolata.AAC.19
MSTAARVLFGTLIEKESKVPGTARGSMAQSCMPCKELYGVGLLHVVPGEVTAEAWVQVVGFPRMSPQGQTCCKEEESEHMTPGTAGEEVSKLHTGQRGKTRDTAGAAELLDEDQQTCCSPVQAQAVRGGKNPAHPKFSMFDYGKDCGLWATQGTCNQR